MVALLRVRSPLLRWKSSPGGIFNSEGIMTDILLHRVFSEGLESYFEVF